MEGFFHTIQHSISHLWCCYLPTIKAMIIPGIGFIGSLQILKLKMKEWIK